MEKLRLRCPSCSKLYEVSEADIKSHSPQFDCVVCATRFGFDFQPGLSVAVANSDSLPTYIVSKSLEAEQARTFQQELESKSLAALQTEIGHGNEKSATRACPKCGALNDKKLSECYSCHVLFERMEQLPLDPLLRAQPSLVRKWKNLVLNFDNKQLHEEFIDSCHQLEALRFAMLKYEELKKAQGGADETCTAMIAKAQSLIHVTPTSKIAAKSSVGNATFAKSGGSSSRAKASPKTWEKWVLWTPVVISLAMMIVGFLSLSLRNLVGAGVAVLLLTLGLVLFWKGRISISDFHGR